ncbi:exonuclease subunit SbcD [Bacteroides sp. OttesenSCG-928-M17]|nr:exonuclease subunit SbcD [Bacteroides sp. OttesenSCG-928-M17]
MIRILHTADWHLGQTFFGYDRTAEHQHFLDWLCDQVKVLEIDALIVAGDLFDVANPSSLSQRMFYRFIRRVTLENPRLQIVVVAGNHDSAGRLEAPQPLLEEINMTVKGSVKKRDGMIDYDDLIVELRNASGEVEAFCLAVPFLRQGDYPTVDAACGNPYTEGVKELYKQLTQHALLCKQPGQALVAVGHLQATGSEIAGKDHSERTIIGGLEAVSPEAFSSDIAYTALGHIHKSQRVSGREDVRYAGSPLSMSFAEKHYKHGVVLVTLDKGTLSSIEKIEYTPLVPLLSIPNGAPEPPERVLELIEQLPERTDDCDAPYLELNVLFTEPDPMFPRLVRDALAEKQVRLGRIVPSYLRGDELSAEEEILTVGLQEMDPLQIMKKTFEKTYGNELPEELLQLFQEARRSLLNEKEQNTI